jgi:hypothetical protein
MQMRGITIPGQGTGGPFAHETTNFNAGKSLSIFSSRKGIRGARAQSNRRKGTRTFTLTRRPMSSKQLGKNPKHFLPQRKIWQHHSISNCKLRRPDVLKSLYAE